MKEIYEKSILERVRKEVKIGNEYEIRVIKNGDKITYDGMEYFDTIEKVGVFFQNHLVVMYDLVKKNISWKRAITNVVIAEKTTRIVNNFVGREIIEVPRKLLVGFSNFVEEVDPDCNMSDIELADLYRLQ